MTINIPCSVNYYRGNYAIWSPPYNGTELFAGTSSSGTFYRSLFGFDWSVLSGAVIDSALFHIYRFVRDSSLQHNLDLYPCNNVVLGNGTYTLLITPHTPIVFTVTANAGWKTKDITPIADVLRGAPDRWLIMLSEKMGSYTEFYAIEKGSNYRPYLEVEYHYPSKVMIGGLEKNLNFSNCKVMVDGAAKPITGIKVKVDGVTRTVF